MPILHPTKPIEDPHTIHIVILTFHFVVVRATGYMMYGEQYREQISETIRHAAELCDCLQCFFLIHSMGGGNSSVAYCKALRQLTTL